MAEGAPKSPSGPRINYRNASPPQRATASSPSGPRGSILPYVVLVVVTFFLTWFVFATITGLPVGFGPSQTSRSSSGTAGTGVLLAIDNPFDTGNNTICSPCTDQFAPANFSVPADTLLEFTITNYDTGENPVTPAQASVNGTVSNCIYLNSTPTVLGPCVHSVPTGFVAHTFSFESGPYQGFNVPVPSANDSNSGEGGSGATVTFFAYFNETGTFTWNCVAPCDPWSMAHDGFMTGTMTVVAP